MRQGIRLNGSICFFLILLVRSRRRPCAVHNRVTNPTSKILVKTSRNVSIWGLSLHIGTDIGKVRADMKAQAPNGDVARRFDQDFARRVGYSIVDGARSAATANKQYQKETNTSVQANALAHIAANAKDDNRFETELGIGLETVKSSDDYKGGSPETRQQHEQAFVSGAWATRLQSMSKTDPLRARELFNKN